MRCKYSFKEFIHSKILANYSFNKFIHSKKSEIIHSMKIFIHLKNGLSPTPNLWRAKRGGTVADQRQKNPVCEYALHTGKFLRVQKVFAHIYKIDP